MIVGYAYFFACTVLWEMFVYSSHHFLATNLQNLSAHLSSLHSTRAPEHNSSCGRSPHPHSICDRISERAARAGGQIGCSVRVLTFGRGKKIWAVKKKWEGCWGMLRLLIMTACVRQNKNSGNIRRRDCRDENKHQAKEWKREFLLAKIKHLD